MPYLNFGLGVQMEFRRQNYQREHGHGRESHCVTTSIQKLEMTEGTPKKKKKAENLQMMRPNSAVRYVHKTPTDFSVLDEGKWRCSCL